MMKQSSQDNKKGFTIIEVMLVLGIMGLMLVGVLGGTYSTINSQRYNDSVQSFAEFLRQSYSEVANPEGILGDKAGLGTTDQAIYGKILVFGDEQDDKSTVYSATLVGNIGADIKTPGLIGELLDVGAVPYCSRNSEVGSTVGSYSTIWGTQIKSTPARAGASLGTFKGMVIIARTPSSGVIQTAYLPDATKVNLKEQCQPADYRAVDRFRSDLKNTPSRVGSEINFCLKSELSSIIRNVRILEDASNTSAITLVTDDGDSLCY